jgi:hypothetical protein
MSAATGQELDAGRAELTAIGSVDPYFGASSQDVGLRGISWCQQASRYSARMAIYRLHDTTDDDLGLLEHPAPNLEAGDVVVIPDGREALVTARVEAEPGPLAALLEVAIAPTPLTSDDSIA